MEGGVHEMVAEPSAGAKLTVAGAPGVVDGVVITGVAGTPLPAAFTAITRT